MNKACVMEYNFLRFVEYVKLSFWDTKRYTKKTISSKFEIVELFQCIEEQNKRYKLSEEEKEYGILGVNNKEGIFDAYLQKGKEINQPYKKMEVDWIAYNPYRINVGSIGIRLKEHLNEYISPAYVVFSCLNNLKPEYLFLMFKTPTFNNIINESTTGSVRQNLTFETLKNIQIPLPSFEEQEAIVLAYQSKIEEAQQLENEAQQLENEIENYLFEELGVNFQKYENLQSGKLHFVEFKDMESWGVSNNFSDSPSNIFQSKKYPLISIQNFFLINPTTNISVDEEISFIPMASVSDEYGEIIKKENRKLAKGYTRFQENDILWARITPCMENGKSSIAKELKNGFGFGSTEFHILRKFSNGLNEELLHLLLRTSYLRQNAKKYFTGSAGQQRVPKSYLENLKIPIPPLSKQNEIVATIATMKQTQKQKTKTATSLRAEALVEFEQVIFS